MSEDEEKTEDAGSSLLEKASTEEAASDKRSASLVERVMERQGGGLPKARGVGRPKADLVERSAQSSAPPSKPNVTSDDASPADPSASAVGDHAAHIARDKGVAGPSPAAPRPTERADDLPADRPVADIDFDALKAAGYITPDMPTNLLAEEFRIIKRSLVLNAFSKSRDRVPNSNMILVSSSTPGEGKTFCTINLALSIATEQDVTVLLIDADFSKPDVLGRLGIASGKGLMDILADPSLTLADCLVRTNIPNLVVLPAGRPHNLGTELLASDRMREIVAEMSGRYSDRLILFDSPPALASSAASVLALHTGQGVFVIESERTTETQVKESLNLLSGCPKMTLLLNKARYSGTTTKFATYYGYGGK